MRFSGGGMRGRVSKKVMIDGFIFDSKLEARRYGELKILEKARNISGLIIHPVWKIDINGVHICDYEADFKYYKEPAGMTVVIVVEDVKDFRLGKDGKIKFSTMTAGYRLKKKLMAATHGINVIEWPERPKITRNKKLK